MKKDYYTIDDYMKRREKHGFSCLAGHGMGIFRLFVCLATVGSYIALMSYGTRKLWVIFVGRYCLSGAVPETTRIFSTFGALKLIHLT